MVIRVKEGSRGGSLAGWVARWVAGWIAMAPRWHQGTIAPRALKKNKKQLFVKNAQKQILVLRAF